MQIRATYRKDHAPLFKQNGVAYITKSCDGSEAFIRNYRARAARYGLKINKDAVRTPHTLLRDIVEAQKMDDLIREFYPQSSKPAPYPRGSFL